MEFPHILQLIKNFQFDTIYHEHFSYFSFHTIQKIFSHHRLKIFDVEELSTHGGSLRIYVKHEEDESKRITNNVNNLNQKERDFGCDKIETYKNFQEIVNQNKKKNIKDFFIKVKNENKKDSRLWSTC